MRTVRIIMSVVVLCAGACAADAQVTGYETLANWSDLTHVQQDYVSLMASSYDRAGGNFDWNYYQSPEGFLNAPENDNQPVTLLDLQGPGVLTRWWMPHATANRPKDLLVTIDGTTTILTNTNALFGGAYNATDAGLFKGPLVQTGIGGQVVYEPIAFQQSLKIESVNRIYTSGNYADRYYYQCNYRLYNEDASVSSYTGSLDATQAAARQRAVSVLNQIGSNPAGASSTATRTAAAQTIAAGQGLSVVQLGRGQSGAVRELALKMDSAGDADLQNLRLRIRYDGQSEYAVDVPVGAFFGAVSATAPKYQSLPMGTDSDDGFYCYFPMPYRDGLAVELYNAGDQAISIDGALAEYEAGPVTADAGYFHAVYQESLPGRGNHQILNVEGSGHYIGNILTLRSLPDDPDGLNRIILEGDEIITVDGNLALHGTGLEDAYNGGFYYNHVFVQTDDGDLAYPDADQTAFAGLILMDTLADRPDGSPDILSGILQVSQYRWMLQDMVPFTDSLKVEIENYNHPDALYASTAFYYQVPEPASAAILLLAAAAIARIRRRA